MLIDRGAGDDEDVRMKEVTYSHVIHGWMRSSNESERGGLQIMCKISWSEWNVCVVPMMCLLLFLMMWAKK